MKSTSGLKVGSKLEWHYNGFGNPSLIMEVTRVTPGKIVVSYNDGGIKFDDVWTRRELRKADNITVLYL